MARKDDIATSNMAKTETELGGEVNKLNSGQDAQLLSNTSSPEAANAAPAKLSAPMVAATCAIF